MSPVKLRGLGDGEVATPADDRVRIAGADPTPAPAERVRSKRRQQIAWLSAVLVAVLVLTAVFSRTPAGIPAAAEPASAASSAVRGDDPSAPSAGTSAAVTTSSVAATTPGTTLAAAELLPAPRPVAAVRNQQSAQSAVTALEALRVAGRAPKTGYSRAQFGDAWTDDTAVESGHNGCDTRNDILRRDLVDRTVRAGSHGCVVTAGSFTDPYTGRMLQVEAGRTTAVQIDHVVALSDAWQTGAAALSKQQRQDLANDPLNLQTTAAAVNQAKGDGDAATWLPPDKSYRCTYVARQVAVKAKYGLWVTVAERQAMSTVLTACGATAAAAATTSAPPTETLQQPPVLTPPEPATTANTTPAAETALEQTTTLATTSGGARAYYRSCAAARAAGAAPLHRGEPGYRAGLDGDDDGTACE